MADFALYWRPSTVDEQLAVDPLITYAASKDAGHI